MKLDLVQQLNGSNQWTGHGIRAGLAIELELQMTSLEQFDLSG